jgi:hypothetical protein
MTAIANGLFRTIGTDVEVEALKSVLMLYGVGLAVSLGVASYARLELGVF